MILLNQTLKIKKPSGVYPCVSTSRPFVLACHNERTIRIVILLNFEASSLYDRFFFSIPNSTWLDVAAPCMLEVPKTLIFGLSIYFDSLDKPGTRSSIETTWDVGQRLPRV